MMDKYENKASKQKRIRNCHNKIIYNTPEHAEVAGRNYQQKPYICPICNKYHLTSRKFKPFNWNNINKERKD